MKYSKLPIIPIEEGEKVLDLGCGTAKTKGSYGIDIADLEGVDLVYDLNVVPYPFDSETFDWVIMNDILEHLDNPIDVIREVHRILKKGGKLYIRVLYWNHKYNYSDPQHKHAFTEIYFEFFTGKRRAYYFDFKFEDMKVEYTFDRNAIDKYGDNPEILMKKVYFHCNIIDGMHVTLIK